MTPFIGTNTVTSPFGMRTHPISGQWKLHKGQDITTTGDWTVRSVRDGVVRQTGYNKEIGYFADIWLAGSTDSYLRYQHLQKGSTQVAKGEKVTAGQAIGVAGNTGHSTGRHLHLGLCVKGEWQNPQACTGLPNQKGSYPGSRAIVADGTGAAPAQCVQMLDVYGSALQPVPAWADADLQTRAAGTNGQPLHMVDGRYPVLRTNGTKAVLVRRDMQACQDVWVQVAQTSAHTGTELTKMPLSDFCNRFFR